jgi:hypothetical protein
VSEPIQLKMGRIKIRSLAKAEADPLYHSWIESYRKTSAKVREVPQEVYEREQRRTIDLLLARPTVVVACACDAEDPEQIWSWICGELRDHELVVHYAYTKQPFRRVGALNALLAAMRNGSSKPLYYTHWTFHSDKIAPKYSAAYNPWLAHRGTTL